MTWSGVGGYPGAQASPAAGGMGNPASERWGTEGLQLRWANDGVSPSIPQGLGAAPEAFGGDGRRIDGGKAGGCSHEGGGAPMDETAVDWNLAGEGPLHDTIMIGDQVFGRYTIQEGDTLDSIAAMFGLTPEDVEQANDQVAATTGETIAGEPGTDIYIPLGNVDDVFGSLSWILEPGNEDALQAFLAANPGVTEGMLREWEAQFQGPIAPTIGASAPVAA